MGKRILAMLLVLCMAASVAACTAAPASSTESTAGASTAEGSEASTDAPASDAPASDAPASDALGWTASKDVTGTDAVPGETDDRAFKKFDKTVEVHIGRQVDPVDTTLAEGEDAGNNMWTRYLEEKFNIKTVIDWTAGSAADYQQKVAMTIASANMPDGMLAPTRTYLVKGAQSELLADMFTNFNDYASKQVKEIMETTNGRSYENGTYNGTFYGMPNVTVDTDGVYVYFIRKDWLDQVKLEVPKTVAELEVAAQKFKDAGLSPNYSIAGKGNSGRTYANFLESSNNGTGFDAVYQAMNATPGYFLKDDAGEMYYGTNTPEMRASLETLASWYKKGLINPELGTSPSGSELDGIKAGTCGIFMGPWWSLGYGNGDSFKNDPTANWQSYPLYTDDGEWNLKMKDCGTTYTMVSKNATDEVKHAIVVMNNALVRDESLLIQQPDSPAVDWWPLRNTMAAGNECEYEYEALYEVLKGEKTAEEFNVPGSLYKNLYADALSLGEVIKKEYDPSKELSISDMDITKNFGMFQRYYAIMIGNRPYATIEPTNKIFSELYANIDVMDRYWTTLQDMEDQMVMSIITGKADITAFDSFITEWKAQGGDKILEGVKEFVG